MSDVTKLYDAQKSNFARWEVLKDLIEAGTVTPIIEKSYPLSAVPEAIRHLGAGHARGKVVITV